MANAQDVLLEALQDLESKELKSFIRNLTNGVEGFDRIPKGLLENADSEDTVDKMVERYGISGAEKITLTILKKIHKNRLAEELKTKLRKAGGGQVLSESSAASSTTLTADKIQLKLKEEFKKKFANLYEGTSQEGDYAPLKDIFTELYVIKGCTGGVNAQHEVRQMEGFYPKPGETSVNFSEIFKVQSGENKSGTNVLTLGIAGVGKTASVHKFILDWAEERHNQDLDFILFLPFRELNLIKDNSLSLQELLHYFHPELCRGDITEILNRKYTVALILDGLDESKIPLNFNQEKVSNAQEKISLNKLLTGIIKGDLLPSAVIWITSRPAAANQIPRKYFLINTEIRGFNDSQKEEYFRKRIQDQDEASRIISHIKTARSLYILCHIPVFCRISVSVLQEIMKKDKEMEHAPTTLTEMYIRFLIFHTRQKKEKYNLEQNMDSAVPSSKRDKMGAEGVLKLAKLAFLQLQKEQLIFYEEDLKECDIEVEEAVLYSGVCTQIFKKDEKFYSFVHLSFQEFLAAVFVFLTFSDESNPLLQTWWEKIKWRYQHTLDDLLKTAVEKAMKSKNGHLDLFLRFLFGLTLETNQRLLKSLQPEMEIKKEDLKGTVDYIRRKIKEKKSSEKTINLFHCLSELKDISLTGEIQNFLNSGSLSTQELSSTQWSALVFVLMMSEETQEKFELKKYRASEEGLRRLLPVVKNTQRALLDCCSLSKNICETLTSVLISDSALLELDLSNNDLQDSGVELLSAGLKSSHCKLQILRLASCNLGKKTCESLGSVLELENFSIKELDLSYNDLRDSGVELLSAGLRSSHCKLQILRLASCNLGEKTCESLGSVLKLENFSIEELDLSNNDLQDSGVELLSAGLRSSHCKLQILRLASCNLGEKTCKSLGSVLKLENFSIKELDLSNNDLQDSGVELLSAGLRSSHCKLQILRIASCYLGEKTCESLGSVFKLENFSIKELDLSNNDLQDSGVELLSAGLRSSHCKLQILRLSGCMITEKGCSSLASALISNPSHLKELDLTYNHPGESGEKLLSARLQDPHCLLETLRMEHGGEIRIKAGLKKYGCDFTLDPNTVNRGLSLRKENRKVVNREELKFYPVHPERFVWYEQVLSRERVTGRCYWEAEWSGGIFREGAAVALSYKTIGRNGLGSDCVFGENRKSWSLICFNNRYSVLHNNNKTKLSTRPSGCRRVGVYVDCPSGTLSFYRVSTDTHSHTTPSHKHTTHSHKHTTHSHTPSHTLTHLHTFHTTFTQPLYAGIWVGSGSSVTLCKIE